MRLGRNFDPPRTRQTQAFNEGKTPNTFVIQWTSFTSAGEAGPDGIRLRGERTEWSILASESSCRPFRGDIISSRQHVRSAPDKPSYG